MEFQLLKIHRAERIFKLRARPEAGAPMDSRDLYIRKLREREKAAVERYGLVDEHGNKLDVGYDEYVRKKTDMRAYLAATKCPPCGDPQTEHAGDSNNIPPGGEKSSKKFYTGACQFRHQYSRGNQQRAAQKTHLANRGEQEYCQWIYCRRTHDGSSKYKILV